MPYITKAQMVARFGEAEIEELIAADADSFARAEAHASSVIDGYLASRYTLPLTSVPNLVQAWAADLTRYSLWDERSPEEVRRRQETALEQLKLLADGKISLPPGVDSTLPQISAAPAYYSAERVFTSDTLANF